MLPGPRSPGSEREEDPDAGQKDTRRTTQKWRDTVLPEAITLPE